MRLKINQKWRYAAMDNDKEWWCFTRVPRVGLTGWENDNYGDANLSDIFYIPPFTGDWRGSLHRIVDGQLFELEDVPQAGEPVVVWNKGKCVQRRYSAGAIDERGRLLCWAYGDRWLGENGTYSWKHWRRPTKEELES